MLDAQETETDAGTFEEAEAKDCFGKILQDQKDTGRPGVLSRVDPANSSFTPTSLLEYFSMNLLYACPKCARLPQSRSNSQRETRTATERPRRVNSISMADSAWSMMPGSEDLASVIEYLRDIWFILAPPVAKRFHYRVLNFGAHVRLQLRCAFLTR